MSASVAAAMEFTAAAKSTITSVEVTSAVESAVTAEAFVLKPATAAIPILTIVIAPAVVATTVEAGAPIKVGPPVIAVEPRPSSDENAADEVVRPVITIGCAGVRVVAVVAISADRGRPYICRANSNTDNHSLCVGERC